MSIDIAGVQAAIVNRLKGSLVADGRIYDDVPQDVSTAQGPYVEIAAGIDVEDDTTLSDGIEHILTLNVWSQHKGQKEIKQVTTAIRSALHRQVMDVGAANCIFWIDGATYLDSGDGVTRQAVIRVRANCRT